MIVLDQSNSSVTHSKTSPMTHLKTLSLTSSRCSDKSTLTSVGSYDAASQAKHNGQPSLAVGITNTWELNSLLCDVISSSERDVASNFQQQGFSPLFSHKPSSRQLRPFCPISAEAQKSSRLELQTSSLVLDEKFSHNPVAPLTSSDSPAAMPTSSNSPAAPPTYSDSSEAPPLPERTSRRTLPPFLPTTLNQSNPLKTQIPSHGTRPQCPPPSEYTPAADQDSVSSFSFSSSSPEEDPAPAVPWRLHQRCVVGTSFSPSASSQKELASTRTINTVVGSSQPPLTVPRISILYRPAHSQWIGSESRPWLRCTASDRCDVQQPQTTAATVRPVGQGPLSDLFPAGAGTPSGLLLGSRAHPPALPPRKPLLLRSLSLTRRSPQPPFLESAGNRVVKSYNMSSRNFVSLTPRLPRSGVMFADGANPPSTDIVLRDTPVQTWRSAPLLTSQIAPVSRWPLGSNRASPGLLTVSGWDTVPSRGWGTVPSRGFNGRPSPSVSRAFNVVPLARWPLPAEPGGAGRLAMDGLLSLGGGGRAEGGARGRGGGVIGGNEYVQTPSVMCDKARTDGMSLSQSLRASMTDPSRSTTWSGESFELPAVIGRQVRPEVTGRRPGAEPDGTGPSVLVAYGRPGRGEEAQPDESNRDSQDESILDKLARCYRLRTGHIVGDGSECGTVPARCTKRKFHCAESPRERDERLLSRLRRYTDTSSCGCCIRPQPVQHCLKDDGRGTGVKCTPEDPCSRCARLLPMVQRCLKDDRRGTEVHSTPEHRCSWCTRRHRNPIRCALAVLFFPCLPFLACPRPRTSSRGTSGDVGQGVCRYREREGGAGPPRGRGAVSSLSVVE